MRGARSRSAEASTDSVRGRFLACTRQRRLRRRIARRRSHERARRRGGASGAAGCVIDAPAALGFGATSRTPCNRAIGHLRRARLAAADALPHPALFRGSAPLPTGTKRLRAVAARLRTLSRRTGGRHRLKRHVAPSSTCARDRSDQEGASPRRGREQTRARCRGEAAATRGVRRNGWASRPATVHRRSAPTRGTASAPPDGRCDRRRTAVGWSVGRRWLVDPRTLARIFVPSARDLLHGCARARSRHDRQASPRCRCLPLARLGRSHGGGSCWTALASPRVGPDAHAAQAAMAPGLPSEFVSSFDARTTRTRRMRVFWRQIPIEMQGPWRRRGWKGGAAGAPARLARGTVRSAAAMSRAAQCSELARNAEVGRSAAEATAKRSLRASAIVEPARSGYGGLRACVAPRARSRHETPTAVHATFGGFRVLIVGSSVGEAKLLTAEHAAVAPAERSSASPLDATVSLRRSPRHFPRPYSASASQLQAARSVRGSGVALRGRPRPQMLRDALSLRRSALALLDCTRARCIGHRFDAPPLRPPTIADLTTTADGPRRTLAARCGVHRRRLRSSALAHVPPCGSSPRATKLSRERADDARGDGRACGASSP